MKSILIFSLFSCFFAAYKAKILSKCELACSLKVQEMDGYNGYSLENWVCMAQYASNFNTQACTRRNTEGSSDYGIFQLNSKFCKDNRYSSENICNITCNKLTDDDIDDDISCVKRVVEDSNGMSAWVDWVKHCQDKDLSKYLSDCQLSDCEHDF